MEKLRDNIVLDILNNDVNADAVTFIALNACTGITNATLMCIADKCTQLKYLHVNGCDKISDAGITAVAKKNKKLRRLHYSNCTRVTDAALEVITNECPLLEVLWADGCGHFKLPFDFGTKLLNLSILNLENNNLSTLPESFGQLADKCTNEDFFISGNPLQKPPLAVAEQGFRAIAKYFKEIKDYGAHVCNQQKLVVIGEGESGKTSLVRLLQKFLNSLTDVEDRTIHLDVSDIAILRAIDNFIIRTICNDLGGQNVYELSQAPILTASAMYILVVSAANAFEDKKYQAIIRFLVSLQAIAPRAVVQIVLTKTDLVADPKEISKRAKWVLNVVNGYINQLRENKYRYSGGGFLQIEQEVICTSVKDASQGNFLSKLLTKILPPTVNLNDAPRIFADRLQDDTRKRVLNTIADLTLETPSKLPMVGQIIPLPWFYFQQFVSIVRAIGINNPKELVEVFAQKLKKQSEAAESTDGKNEKDDNKCALPFLTCIQGLMAAESTNSSTRDIFQAKEDERVDGLSGGKRRRGCLYHKKSKLLEVWNFCCDELEDPHIIRDVADKVLNLLEAQGEIFMHAEFVFVQPKFVMEIIRPLVDHKLGSRLNTQVYQNDISEYIRMQTSPSTKPTDHYYLKKALENLVKTGQFNPVVSPFLWYKLELSPDDYDEVNRMLREIGVIFSSTYLAEWQKDDDEQGPAEKSLPVVLYRLSNDPDLQLVNKVWPKVCPSGVKEMEMRIELPGGCPPTLAAHFAAALHQKGRCTYGWLKGAIVVTSDNKEIRASLVEKNDDADSTPFLQVIIRSSTTLGKEEISILMEMMNFMTQEREQRFPGLFFNIFIPCPECSRPTIEWDQNEGKKNTAGRLHFCEECRKHVKLTLFLDIAAAVPSDDKAPMREYEIFISARFDGSQREQDARDLKDELVKIDVDAHMVEAAAGEDFGDKTHEYLYYMKTMIAFCFEDYGQKTKSKYSTYWELKDAYAHDKHILPIKRCAEWPPKPIDHDGGNKGDIQNTSVFKPGVAYLDWSKNNWNPAECAKEVKEALQKRSKPNPL